MAEGAGEVSVQVVRSAGQVGVVRGVSLAGQGVVLPAHVGGSHPLLLLPPVAEPDAHDLLLQLEAVGQRRDLLRRGLRVLLGTASNSFNKVFQQVFSFIDLNHW